MAITMVASVVLVLEKACKVSRRVRVIYTPELPLAMYRELATHLSQVEGILTELIWQNSSKFDYDASQISGMWLSYSHELPAHLDRLTQAILNHYGKWQMSSELSEKLSAQMPVQTSAIGS